MGLESNNSDMHPDNIGKWSKACLGYGFIQGVIVALALRAKKALRIETPSDIMVIAGENIMRGFADALQRASDEEGE